MADFYEPVFSGKWLVNVLELSCSRVLPWVAVPVFFMISGYLYFFNSSSRIGYPSFKDKNIKRLRTLLIPYLIWNIVPIVMSCLKMLLATLVHHKDIARIGQYLGQIDWLHIFWNYHDNGCLTSVFGYSIPWTTPLNSPLWFIRDLIVMVLIAPLIYCFIKNSRKWGVILVVVFYIANVGIPLVGFDPKAVTFFTLGAYFGINRKSFFQTSLKYWKFSLICSVATFLLAMWFTTYFCVNLFILSSLPLCFCIAWKMTEKRQGKSWLVDSCFFIYAAHLVLVLPCCCGYFKTYLPQSSYGWLVFSYFAAPFFCIALLVLASVVLRRLFPKAMQFICGR